MAAPAAVPTVGLTNAGCHDTLNCIIQQLFLVDEVRGAVLALSDDDVAGRESNTCLVRELRALFSAMLENPLDPVDTGPVARHFDVVPGASDGGGWPRTHSMDVCEAMSLLLDQLDSWGAEHGQPALLDCLRLVTQDILEARVASTTPGVSADVGSADDGSGGKAPEDPPAKRSRMEDSSVQVLTVRVKGLPDLAASLRDLVAPETIEGYTWDDSYTGSGDGEGGEAGAESLVTTKRWSLAAAPAVLLIAPRRFEFDFETMALVKVNDRWEFPLMLDLAPFVDVGADGKDAEEGPEEDALEEDLGVTGDETADEPPAAAAKAEAGASGGAGGGGGGAGDGAGPGSASAAPGATDSEPSRPGMGMLYDLRAVVVHTGTAAGGNHSCLVRTRDGEWRHTDSTSIRDFDVADLPDHAFGGMEQVVVGGRVSHREKYRGAVMLQYHRR